MNLGTKNGELMKFDDYIVRQGYTHSTIMQSTIVFLDVLVFMLGSILPKSRGAKNGDKSHGTVRP